MMTITTRVVAKCDWCEQEKVQEIYGPRVEFSPGHICLDARVIGSIPLLADVDPNVNFCSPQCLHDWGQRHIDFTRIGQAFLTLPSGGILTIEAPAKPRRRFMRRSAG